MKLCEVIQCPSGGCMWLHFSIPSFCLYAPFFDKHITGRLEVRFPVSPEKHFRLACVRVCLVVVGEARGAKWLPYLHQSAQSIDHKWSLLFNCATHNYLPWCSIHIHITIDWVTQTLRTIQGDKVCSHAYAPNSVMLKGAGKTWYWLRKGNGYLRQTCIQTSGFHTASSYN